MLTKLSIAMDVGWLARRCFPYEFPAEPGSAANDKLNLTGLQRTFIPTQSSDSANHP
jgi:hypothetical protein